MISKLIKTPRLNLIAATPALLIAELTSRWKLSAALNAIVPEDWPPGEYDRDAIEFFYERLMSGGKLVEGWYGWYAVKRSVASGDEALVASGGYFGPPDADGVVEIGYSVSENWRRCGIATEIVGALVENAFSRQAKTVIAHTHPDNLASINVLRRSGFVDRESVREGTVGFEFRRT